MFFCNNIEEFPFHKKILEMNFYKNFKSSLSFVNNSSCSDTEQDIHAYVKEMTKEITKEIKSEIREVISQVEDVLENSETVDIQAVMANINRYENAALFSLGFHFFSSHFFFFHEIFKH